MIRKCICIILSALFCTILSVGCGSHDKESVAVVGSESIAAKEVEKTAAAAGDLTVWSAYWDCDSDYAVIRDEAQYIDSISLFAAYFKDGELFIPDASLNMLKKIRKNDELSGKRIFLSVVNDTEENGVSVQKDTNLLYRLLDNEDTAKAHATELVAAAVDNGFDGIEIDYEKIRNDTELWRLFIRFENYLIAAADRADISVRVVLESGTPTEKLSFPEGAEYAVMCYNLYGNGTEPGPKADYAFLKDIYERFGKLPGISYALSDRGFDWEAGSVKPAQTDADAAAETAAECEAKAIRDDESGAMHFDYDKDGKRHTVWYADEVTLSMWAAELAELSGKPVNVSLWRL